MGWAGWGRCWGPAGWEPAGREPAAWEPAGWEPAGWEPAAWEPAGWEPAGREPAGWEPAECLVGGALRAGDGGETGVRGRCGGDWLLGGGIG
ncbi:hypothetical protein Abr02nite_06980 [Paractinoplanes brasiliensis]|nr:hypothetical protein Abr02nite_06980 [Actinoplanes brasiliensis]